MGREEGAYLINKELGDPFTEPTLLAAEDHLQHVSSQLLHHNEYSVRGLEHTLHIHDALSHTTQSVLSLLLLSLARSCDKDVIIEQHGSLKDKGTKTRLIP